MIQLVEFEAGTTLLAAEVAIICRVSRSKYVRT